MSNMVVCPEPPAAQAGAEIFAAGGNAIDAAVATAFAQAVTSPLMTGLGGGGSIHYYDAGRRQPVVLNFQVAAGSRPIPASWADEYVGKSETVGRYIIRSEANQVGHQSAMTPGLVRGCWVAFQRFGSGRVSWADVLAPAARLATDGFEVFPHIAAFWKGVDEIEEKPGYPGLRTKLGATPDARRFYLKPDGSVFQAGDILKQPDLGRTIQRLAEAGGDDFYTGEIAQAIASDMAKNGGFITTEDLRDFAVYDEQPVRGWYRGLEVNATPPPSGGPQVIQMLQILEHFDVAGLGHNTPEYVDTLARIQRGMFADYVRQRGLTGDEARPIVQEITSPARARYWAERVKRGDRIVVRGGAVNPGTTHLTCVDAQRNVVCMTHSIGSIAGSGAITPGLGFLYNNFLGQLNPRPGEPDSIVPRKRRGGSVPTILYRDGEPYIGIGAPGGSRLLTSTIQALVNVIDHQMDLRAAVTVPRFHSEEEQIVFIEPAFPEPTAEALRAMGNDVRRSTYMSRVQAIRILPNGDLEAGPDPRGGAGVGRYP